MNNFQCVHLKVTLNPALDRVVSATVEPTLDVFKGITPAPLPAFLTPPRFRIGQIVTWIETCEHNTGRIALVAWASQSSIIVVGYHYLVALYSTSPGYSLETRYVWVYESLLAVAEPSTPLPPENSLDMLFDALQPPELDGNGEDSL